MLCNLELKSYTVRVTDNNYAMMIRNSSTGTNKHCGSNKRFIKLRIFS